jgi:hypothetical protein
LAGKGPKSSAAHGLRRRRQASRVATAEESTTATSLTSMLAWPAAMAERPSRRTVLALEKVSEAPG